jgi:3-methyladenine DNA glycosylase AlkD
MAYAANGNAMDQHHADLVRVMRAAASAGPRTHGGDYLGTASATLNIATSELRKLAREWTRANKNMSKQDVLRLCDRLFAGKTHQEKALGAILLSYDSEVRAATTLERLERWLGHTHGWAEVDSLCSNVFKAEQVLEDWKSWKAFLNRLSRDANINKRRASLVLMTGPVRYSDDKRLSEISFALIERLKGERDSLITKAISWLLRTLTLRRKGEVSAYLKTNEATLPRVAVRETMTKLKTGTKSGRSAKRR